MIVLDKVTKRFGPKILFENVSMQFDPGKRYGLTGANGAGKSTLLKMLGGDEDTDQGSITIPGNLRLGVLKQNHFEYDEERIIDTVIMGNKVLWDAMVEKERLLEGEMTDEIGIRLGELEGTIGEENGYMAESEAAELLVGLGIAPDKHESKMNTLAPGYKLRVLIAQVLYGKPDVLLLDEPTNHLDLESIRWLEHFLTEEFKGTLVVVSHDRHFLNSVATHIADVDYQTITVYAGDYADFVDQKYENNQRAAQQAASAKKKVAELQEFVRRFSANKSKARQATSRAKQIEKIKIDEFKPSSRQYPWIRFDYDEKEKLHRQAVEIENLTFAYDDGETIIKNLTFTADAGDKIAVIGENGVGKTTLMKLLVGELKPQKGSIKWAEKARLGYYAQDHSADFDSDESLTEWISGYVREGGYEGDDAETLIRGTLGRLLFKGDEVRKPVRVISGGEQGRMAFGKLMLQRKNVLLLDEPTNHLDMESIEALNLGIADFNGTLFFVSHDREFVSSVATRVLEIKQDHRIVDYRGTYEEYLASQGIE